MWIQIPRNYHSMIINNISITVATWQHTKPQKRTKHAKHNEKPISKGKIGSNCKLDPSIQVQFPENERINIHFNLPKRWSHRAPESPANTNKIMKQNPLSLLSHTKREEKSTEKLNGRNVALEIDNGRRKAIYIVIFTTQRKTQMGNNVFTAFLDSEKAFDCVKHRKYEWFWRRELMAKMPTVWETLWEQVTAISLNGKLSEWTQMKRGVGRFTCNITRFNPPPSPLLQKQLCWE